VLLPSKATVITRGYFSKIVELSTLHLQWSGRLGFKAH